MSSLHSTSRFCISCLTSSHRGLRVQAIRLQRCLYLQCKEPCIWRKKTRTFFQTSPAYCIKRALWILSVLSSRQRLTAPRPSPARKEPRDMKILYAIKRALKKSILWTEPSVFHQEWRNELCQLYHRLAASKRELHDQRKDAHTYYPESHVFHQKSPSYSSQSALHIPSKEPYEMSICVNVTYYCLSSKKLDELCELYHRKGASEREL